MCAAGSPALTASVGTSGTDDDPEAGFHVCARCGQAGPVSGGLAGKTAVVTGTAHGIGAGIADALRGDGATVHGVDKDTADLSVPAAVAAFFGGIGPVDILVNCAGGVAGQVGRALEDVTVQDWRAVLDANLSSTFLCTRAVVAGMKERRWGRIVNISSGAGLGVSLTGIQAYTSAKAAQIGFTRQMAHDLHRARLRPVEPDQRGPVAELRRGRAGGAAGTDQHAAAGRARGHRQRGPVLRGRAVLVGDRPDHLD
jgi:NADP-dependent 3-hydroxy acid dehydrogenase YdfG